MMTDLIADMLTRVRNGQKARLKTITAPYSKFGEAILKVIRDEGYINGFEVKNIRKGIDELAISLRYTDGRNPVIKEIKKISTPGRRIYIASDEVGKFFNGLGVAVLSTSHGVISNVEAKKLNVGGELICKIF